MSERARLIEARNGTDPWKRWGPYLSERQWGTVREDYSRGGSAWEDFPHDHARSRAYRWGEDGLAGLSDDRQLVCLALALWNERDPILKERLFGLTGNEGNHGEDVKEVYYYLDSTPTHSSMRFRYLYPIRAYPYAELAAESARRGRERDEYELTDTNAFADGWFQVDVTYVKAAPEDILMRIDVTSTGRAPARLRVLPTLWLRNTWAWIPRPRLSTIVQEAPTRVRVERPGFGTYWCAFSDGPDAAPPELLFCENESNAERLWSVAGGPAAPKDAINDAVIGEETARLRTGEGSKVAAHYRLDLAPGQTRTVWARLSDMPLAQPFADAEALVARRQREADAFYAELTPGGASEELCQIQRQAWGGLLWSKQFYLFDVSRWLTGDPGHPRPPAERLYGRNAGWLHLEAADILSMPDAWEFPWFASWDLAFHCIPLATVDPDFAKEQLLIVLRDWYQHPNGQIPAYEWAFGDVNPPVHAWAAWQVYRIDEQQSGRGDRPFLERVLHRLLLNFTWWVNRKDAGDNNVFEGGFLGLDNIGAFDRSAGLPGGGVLEQADATAWMAMYSLNMLRIVVELARENPAYDDLATKFFEHFLYIARALNHVHASGQGLWDEEDGFYYDAIRHPDGRSTPLRLRTMVGLIPLFASTLGPYERAGSAPWVERAHRFVADRPDLADHISVLEHGAGEQALISLVPPGRLRRILARVLDEREFLSPYGVRSLSRAHGETPYELDLDGARYRVEYEPGESRSGLFGGNSNWRGPIWLPVNFLLVQALHRFHRFYSDRFTVPCPEIRAGGAVRAMTLGEVAEEITTRLLRIFQRDEHGRRPVFGYDRSGLLNAQEGILFHEYFHGDTGRGVGASHQTGWTALVARLIDQSASRPEHGPARRPPAPPAPAGGDDLGHAAGRPLTE